MKTQGPTTDADVKKLSTVMAAHKFYYKDTTRYVNVTQDQLRTQFHHHKMADVARYPVNEALQQKLYAWKKWENLIDGYIFGQLDNRILDTKLQKRIGLRYS